MARNRKQEEKTGMRRARRQSDKARRKRNPARNRGEEERRKEGREGQEKGNKGGRDKRSETKIMVKSQRKQKNQSALN